MARKKKIIVPVNKNNKAKLAESFNPETSDLMKRLHLNREMSASTIVRTAREYLEKQPNQIRACNAILFKLGVQKQFKDESRKARIYAFTAIEESLVNGENFDPSTVSGIADKRLRKIEMLLGRDPGVVVQSEESSSKPKSKKDMVVDIFVKNKEKPTSELIKLIVDSVKVEKQSAYSLLYAARKSMIV